MKSSHLNINKHFKLFCIHIFSSRGHDAMTQWWHSYMFPNNLFIRCFWAFKKNKPFYSFIYCPNILEYVARLKFSRKMEEVDFLNTVFSWISSNKWNGQMLKCFAFKMTAMIIWIINAAPSKPWLTESSLPITVPSFTRLLKVFFQVGAPEPKAEPWQIRRWSV